MDQGIRNKLRGVVTQCRRRLEDSVRQELQGKFGIYAAKKDDVQVDEEIRLNLTAEERPARKDILDHFAHIKARGFKAKDALDQLVREIAFTHLNRLCAYKMMAARQVVVGEQRIYDVVGKGENSKLVQFFLADRPDEKQLFDKGQQAVAYRHCLDWLGGLLSEEIGVLFNPNDSANRLYPPQHFLAQVLDLINDESLADIWADDETIGWVYQYFTPVEDRAKARKESRSPRNSYELAFRNQFFTPRYVVEFLTDNTLGRTWYEMRKGDTKLKDQCRYMVRRPSEIFLAVGQNLPKATAEGRDKLSQEELLKLPVYIPHRPKKDPRELKILDPACGSGHFLLYCFDLLLTIYEEAYDDPDLGPALKKEYPTLADLKKAVPGLILAHNLHGIDIDLRCTQIAALALWLRCQRAYQDMGIKKDRPNITRSNFVCAEPMPGEQQMLKEFLAQLESKFLGQLVEVVFEKMELAGDAGSLLKIEEEIRDAIASARKQWVAETVRATDRKGQPMLFSRADMERLANKPQQGQLFDLSEISDDQFFEQAEAKLAEALRSYAEQANNGQRLQKRLFAEDTVRGFAFVDLCRKRFDVVLMNPPFGELNAKTKDYIQGEYENSSGDILANFVERTLSLCRKNGFVGAITNRNCFYLTTMTDYRKEILQEQVRFEALLDLGEGVLDAMVEPAAYVMRNLRQPDACAPFIRLLIDADKEAATSAEIAAVNNGQNTPKAFYSVPSDFSRLASAPFCYWVPSHVIAALSKLPPIEGNTARLNVGLQTGYDWRFLRLAWEVDPTTISPIPRSIGEKPASVRAACLEELRNRTTWAFFSKTEAASPWYSPITMVVNWGNQGYEIKNFTDDKGKVRSRPQNEEFYFRPGFSYSYRTTRLVPYVVPSGVIPTAGRAQVYPEPNFEIDVLGICASRLGSAVARFGGQKFSWPLFQASMVQNIAAVPLGKQTRVRLGKSINSELEARRRILSRFEPWHEFALPAMLHEDSDGADNWQLDSLIGTDLEEQIARDAGLTKADLDATCLDLQEAISIRKKTRGTEDAEESETGDEEARCNEAEGSETENEESASSLIDSSPRSVNEGLLSYCVGVLLGRWDVRFALDRTLIPKAQDVLDPLPACPPGTLVSSDGYPARSGTVVSEEWLRARPNAVYLPDPKSVGKATIPDKNYPIAVIWSGILVDDPEHPDDIVRRVQSVMEVIFDKRTSAVEKEVCEALGVKTLREYFRKGGFWNDHVARYTNSRRKAPIYWLLQSSNKKYGLWLYYHRLDKEILLKALLPKGPVQTKIKLEQSNLDDLRKKRIKAASDAKAAKKLDNEIEEQEELLNELKDFAEKLEQAAKLEFGDKAKLNSNIQYNPDLNDGVVLNIAPLHELVPWKEAKSYWQQLMDGKHEWSSIGRLLREKGLVK